MQQSAKHFPCATFFASGKAFILRYLSQLAKHLSGRRAVRRGDLFFCASLAFLPFLTYSRINFRPP
uniref:Uncharacterized protein n=1 Tax=Siphoviridae sp. ctXX925 TaxID=2826370 RepID=A0A8S5R2G6_9CAUD|nr:MAG TPA: hypothetical protein [Siphoviridae sp. ctXX925]